jgi:hypothetical protein
MSRLLARVKGLMLVSGILTCTMLLAVVAPQATLRSTFGETLEGPLAEVVVRNWGVLIALVGGMLIYGAYVPPVRSLVLVVAALGKATFIGLVLAQGGRFLRPAAVVLVFDTVMVAAFVACLLGMRQRPAEVPASMPGAS